MRQPKCSCGICKYCLKRDYYLQNREEILAKSLEFQRQNKEYVNRKNSNWKKKNKLVVSQREKIRRARHKIIGSSLIRDKDRRSDLMKNYGVTPEWFDSKLESQCGKCAICGCSENNVKNKRMHIDHDHNTDHNRGILCHYCNIALGRLESIEEWAEKALAYLKHYEKEYWAAMSAKYSSC